MESLGGHFSKSIGRPADPSGARLHFAAHSHHPWPDVTEAAQARCWDDAARLLDAKWGHIFSNVLPAAQAHVAKRLNLADPASVVFAPNTHELVRRLLSATDPHRPVRILTTDSEFHSFARQIARLEEDALVEVTRVPAEPFDSFANRFIAELHEDHFDLVFLSQVFFNSGWRVAEIADIVAAVRHDDTLVAVDGYHSFMAVPVDWSALQARAFFIAGGYKYAMAGEGCCFMHCPPGYGPRPRDTGWYAEFGALAAARPGETAYGADASRFAGSTFDPSGLYRFNAAQDWFDATGGDIAAHHAYAQALQSRFLAKLPAVLTGTLMIEDAARRGRFLTFRTKDAEAIETHLTSRGITLDRRGDRLRLGFGVYQSDEGVDRLIDAFN
ncbi:MAG: aminotransferase class V-fold PLP-dependent enzyme [Micropepsaceae bacterium]